MSVLTAEGITPAFHHEYGRQESGKSPRDVGMIKCSHHVIDKALDGIVVTDTNLVQVDRVEELVTHVVVILHMVIKSLQRREGTCDP